MAGLGRGAAYFWNVAVEEVLNQLKAEAKLSTRGGVASVRAKKASVRRRVRNCLGACGPLPVSAGTTRTRRQRALSLSVVIALLPTTYIILQRSSND